MLADLRYALRRLRQSPGFTCTAVLTLALGIGANTAIFSLVHAVLLRQLPFAHTESIAVAPEGLCAAGICNSLNGNAASAFHAREHSISSAEEIAIYTEGAANFRAGSLPAQRLNVVQTSAQLFQVLGVAPALGRGFLPEEDLPGKDAIALISDHLWKSAFSGDPKAVGATILLNSHVLTVVGVLPAGAELPASTDVWTPTLFDPALSMTEGGAIFTSAVLRLKPGVSLAQARAELKTLADAQSHAPNVARMDVHLTSLDDALEARIRPTLLLLSGAVILVLLVACANAAGLLLVRMAARQKEIAVRASLGADRVRLMREQMMEPILLALIGGGCGVWLAQGLLTLLYRLRDSSLADFPRPTLSFAVLAFTAGIALLTGILAGIAPAWLARNQDPGEVLKSGGWWRSGGFAHQQLHRVLVSAEVALALILVAGAGLLLRSMEKLQATPLGYGTEHLLTFSVNLHGKPYDEEKAGSQAIVSYQDRMMAALRGLPGVERVAAVDGVPLRSGPEMVLLVKSGQAQDGGMPRLSTPGYLQTMGIRLESGRDFSEADNAAAPRVVVVTEDLAKKLWPGGNALGQVLTCAWYCGDGATVVGVVAAQKSWGAREDALPLYYVPYRQLPMARMTFVLRSAADPSSLMHALPAVAAQVDPTQPVFAVETMKMLAEDKEGLMRLELLSLTVFGVLSFMLAAVGIYGTISYGVERRTREIGLRMALGADRARVLRTVLREGVLLVLAGTVPGIAGALLLGRLLRSAIFGVPMHDPVTLSATTALFLLVGLIGTAIPATRAAHVEPIEALRQE